MTFLGIRPKMLNEKWRWSKYQSNNIVRLLKYLFLILFEWEFLLHLFSRWWRWSSLTAKIVFSLIPMRRRQGKCWVQQVASILRENPTISNGRWMSLTCWCSFDAAAAAFFWSTWQEGACAASTLSANKPFLSDVAQTTIFVRTNCYTCPHKLIYLSAQSNIFVRTI